MKAFWENCFQKHYGGFCEKTRAEAKLEVRCWNDTVQKHWKYFFLLKVKDVSCYRQDSVGEIKYGTAEEKWCFFIEVTGRSMTKCCKCYIGIFLVTEMTIMLVLRTCQRRILFLKKILWVLPLLFISPLSLFRNNHSPIIFPRRDFEIHMLIEGTINGRTDVCMHLSMLLCR